MGKSLLGITLRGAIAVIAGVFSSYYIYGTPLSWVVFLFIGTFVGAEMWQLSRRKLARRRAAA